MNLARLESIKIFKPRQQKHKMDGKTTALKCACIFPTKLLVGANTLVAVTVSITDWTIIILQRHHHRSLSYGAHWDGLSVVHELLLLLKREHGRFYDPLPRFSIRMRVMEPFYDPDDH